MHLSLSLALSRYHMHLSLSLAITRISRSLSRARARATSSQSIEVCEVSRYAREVCDTLRERYATRSQSITYLSQPSPSPKQSDCLGLSLSEPRALSHSRSRSLIHQLVKTQLDSSGKRHSLPLPEAHPLSRSPRGTLSLSLSQRHTLSLALPEAHSLSRSPKGTLSLSLSQRHTLSLALSFRDSRGASEARRSTCPPIGAAPKV